jgi:hypothetical protein
LRLEICQLLLHAADQQLANEIAADKRENIIKGPKVKSVR